MQTDVALQSNRSVSGRPTGRYFPGLYSRTAHGAARRRGESGLPSAGNFPRCFLRTLTLTYPNTAGVSRGPRESAGRRRKLRRREKS